mmetsp:Transcript_36239/g.31974  ORF Transcript_36239/g.31974 Transcript_36239/m.31974 type:complete len:219 (+) Transcript_36239:62-718(+)
MAQPKLNFTAEEKEQIKILKKKLEDMPEAGVIKKTKSINECIKTFQILNLESSESTITNDQFPKIQNMNQGLFIVSDADEELIFLIDFGQEIDLESITFHAIQSAKEDEYSAPKDINLFIVDSLNKNFDDVKNAKPDKKLIGKKKKLINGQTFSMKKKAKSTVKFSKVQKLLIYISSNIDDTEQTYLNGIEFKGLIKDVTDMDKWEAAAAEAKKRGEM